MRKFLLLVGMLCAFTASKAQKLSFEKLEQLLNCSLDKTEEELFLVAYSFVSEEKLPDSAGLIRQFSNRKSTIGTAKRVFRGIYYKQPNKSFVKYVTYDRNEFESLRRLMVELQFIRDSKDKISENSNYSKNNLQVAFQVTTDAYENKTFSVRLSNTSVPVANKATRKINLRTIFKQPE